MRVREARTFERLAGLWTGVLAATLIAIVGQAAAQTQLSVFTTLDLEQIEPFRKAFEADNPDIRVVLLRDATGVVTARVMAEKANPSADVIWGLAVTSMIVLDREGILLPYAPKDLSKIKASFRDSKSPPAWVGMDGWASALCFNTIEAGKLKIERPASWNDLLSSRFRNRIVMPHPASSGTGFFAVSAWIQMRGEAKVWEYMDKLDQNIATYVHSGTQPCRMAGTGEFVVGISSEVSYLNVKASGAPVEAVLMKEGGGGTWMRWRSSEAVRMPMLRAVLPTGPRAERRTNSMRGTWESSPWKGCRRPSRTTRLASRRR